jgi:AcrR family transcriptional regulator
MVTNRHSRERARAERAPEGRRHPDRRRDRRRLRPEVRRAELVEAALTVLKGRDPAEVRVEDITKAAGAAKGTFYLYFASWGELMAAVRDDVLGRYVGQLLDRFAAVENSSQWWAALEEECARFVDFHLELGTVHKAIFHGWQLEHLPNPEYSEEQLISRILSQGIALGACRPVDPEMAAPLAFALLHTTADAICRAGQRGARLDALSAVLRSWLRVPENREET